MNNRIIGIDFAKVMPNAIEEVDNTKGFVKWGKKNDYPFYLNELLTGSPTHGGIVKNKIRYIAGLGIEVVEGDATEFLENKHTDFTMSEVADMVAQDSEIYNGVVVKGTWDKAGTKVVMWEHINFDECRFSEDENTCYISDDWNAQIQSAYKTNYRELPVFSENNRTGSFFIYLKENVKKLKKEKGVYPKAPYISGLLAINTEYNINKYNNSLLENGFTTGTLIVFNDGKPESTEEAQKIKDKLQGDTGPENAGSVRVTFSDGKDKGVEVHNLNGNDLDKRYDLTNRVSVESIVKSHQVFYSPLFGLKPEGSFNAAESADLFNIFYVTYVEPRQARLNWLFNLMASLSGVVGKVAIKGVNPFEKKEVVAPIATWSHFSNDLDWKAFEKYGEPIENFDVIDTIDLNFDRVGEIAVKLDDFDKNLLQLLRDKNDSTAISQATKASILDITKGIARLQENGLINKGGEVTKLGERLINNELPELNYELRYVYAVRPNVPEPKTESREFCVNLMAMNKSYSREDINALENDIGTNVFQYRGGYYTNPDTKKTTPYCRHIWRQQIVTRR